jgi:hypothetical protein
MSAEPTSEAISCGADEAVVEDHLTLNPEFPGQGLQLIPVSISLARPDMRVSCACDDVDSVLVAGEDARQGLNHVLESLVGREQTEGEQYKLAPDGERIFVNLRLHKRQVGDAVRNQVDLRC